jgi:hypothetical protein
MKPKLDCNNRESEQTVEQPNFLQHRFNVIEAKKNGGYSSYIENYYRVRYKLTYLQNDRFCDKTTGSFFTKHKFKINLTEIK